jgi:uncharacterized protein DUF4258
MPILADVKAAISGRRYRITGHAAVEMVDDRIDEVELLAATASGEVIEDYPTSKPCPACLVLGYADPGRPIHSVWAYAEVDARAILVTTYRPDPERWSKDLRRRVKR